MRFLAGPCTAKGFQYSTIIRITAPIWSIDQELWEKYETTFVESYNKVCPWLQQICYDGLLSQFSSGKLVVVNFGDKPYKYGDHTIEPRGFKILS
ncbi:hypothetical protein [Paenibacillus wynnii]|uniref:Uncharacterized protein n=1 Tax=Paenibacillus wynnii TaxID=268407 RepID=A0A098M849_9BACL|nr:hypothetical protein [Paenibacillus wynnii]KGE18749.1 hypothetical protein PWYN_04720 [Paenibacillus wynnii]